MKKYKVVHDDHDVMDDGMRQTTMTQAYPKRVKHNDLEGTGTSGESEDNFPDESPPTPPYVETLDDDDVPQESIATAMLPETVGSVMCFPQYDDGRGNNNEMAMAIDSASDDEDTVWWVVIVIVGILHSNRYLIINKY